MERRLTKALAEQITGEKFPRYNPVYFYGESVRVAAVLDEAEANCRRHDKKILRMEGEQFTDILVQAIAGGRWKVLRETLREADVLIFSSAEMLCGKRQTQEEFYSLFDHYYESGRQIVIGASALPGWLEGLSDRICTQFAGGVICCVDDE